LTRNELHGRKRVFTYSGEKQRFVQTKQIPSEIEKKTLLKRGERGGQKERGLSVRRAGDLSTKKQRGGERSKASANEARKDDL